jgi:hypothetical protein
MEAKKGRRNNQDNTLAMKMLVGISFALIVISSCFLAYHFFTKPLEMRVVEATFIVGKSIGFDLNTTALTFGKVVPGGSSTRNMTITNTYEFPIRVEILADRNISSFLTTETEFLLFPGEKKDIAFTLSVPSNLSYGNYSGRVLFEMHKARK